ncbi:MAG TPA: lysophospholipid acyltransferase family protein [Bryobacteraceae bacterium]|nr:lysophospholipid acyltransferase family protein [Bryobacteraceae bacterium]
MWKLRSTLFTAPAFAIATILMACLSLTSSLWDRRGVAQHNIARAWSRMLLAFAFVRCTVVGAEKIDPTKHYVFVCNHASYMDTPALLSSIPIQFRFFAKKGLFSIPFMGWHLHRAGHIPVHLDDARASLRSLSAGAKMIRERNISVLLFPEGGRVEHDMEPFKEGAAYIAIKAQAQVIPIGLIGTREILPMHHGMIRSGNVQVIFGDPIDTAGMTTKDRGALNQLLQDKVAHLARQTVITT